MSDAMAKTEELPDLTQHHSLMAEVLRKNPAIFARLRSASTPLNVMLSRCIRTGIDNPGAPQCGSDGVVAGDADCYGVFRELFDPVLAGRHPYVDVAGVRHASDLDRAKVRDT